MTHAALPSILLALAFTLSAQAPVQVQAVWVPVFPVPPSGPVKLSGAEFDILTAPNYIGAVTWDLAYPSNFTSPVELVELGPEESVIGIRAGTVKPQRHFAPKAPSVAVFAIGTGTATVTGWGIKDGKAVKLVTFQLEANAGPRPPPEPKPPEPKPPEPAKSFRVIFAVESGQTLTAAQSGVIYGVEVENWLVKNCTGGKDGFRRRDKDNPNVTGKELAEIWNAARPLITTTPVAIVEKNTHIEIIPVEATPAKMTAVFQEYLDGKRGK